MKEFYTVFNQLLWELDDRVGSLIAKVMPGLWHKTLLLVEGKTFNILINRPLKFVVISLLSSQGDLPAGSFQCQRVIQWMFNSSINSEFVDWLIYYWNWLESRADLLYKQKPDVYVYDFIKVLHAKRYLIKSTIKY